MYAQLYTTRAERDQICRYRDEIYTIRLHTSSYTLAVLHSPHQSTPADPPSPAVRRERAEAAVAITAEPQIPSLEHHSQ